LIQHLTDHTVQNLEKTIRDRCAESTNLVNTIKAFQKRSSAQHQPGNKLHDAITHSASQTASMDIVMANPSLDALTAFSKPHLDLRIGLGGLEGFGVVDPECVKDGVEVLDVHGMLFLLRLIKH
jgi:hypothetical protein